MNHLADLFNGKSDSQSYQLLDTATSSDESVITRLQAEETEILQSNSLLSTKSKLLIPLNSWKKLNTRIKLLSLFFLAGTAVNLIFFVKKCVEVAFVHKQKIATDEGVQLTVHNYTSYVEPLSLMNASFLFNSVNSFLKQKDSDVFPVGVSFVPAIISKDTLVYHYGTGIPTTFEWLAMDVEFSLNFGSRNRVEKRGRALVEENINRRKQHDNDSASDEPPSLSHLDKRDVNENENNKGNIDYCEPFNEEDPHLGPPEIIRNGKNGEPRTLMTFQLKHDLHKLIYLDGASASKADSTGEMDTQKILYNQIKQKYPNLPESPSKFMKERDYASMICEWGALYGVEGYIRLELGFEVVLCDFEKHLSLISNVTLNDVNNLFNFDKPVDISAATGWPINCTDGTLNENELTEAQNKTLELEDLRFKQLATFGAANNWEQVRVAGFWHNTGEKRVSLDYRHMVTAINETELDHDNYKWKIHTADSEELQRKLFDSLDQVVQDQERFNPSKSNDWQSKTEQIQYKFTPFIKNIQLVLNDENATAAEKAMKLVSLTYPIISRYQYENFLEENSAELAQMAVWEYTYPAQKLSTKADQLIFSALTTVMDEVIVFIQNVYELALPVANNYLKKGEADVTGLVFAKLAEDIDILVTHLNWISFGYNCSKKCGLNELCYTPSWGPSPVGWVSIKENDSRRPPNSRADLPIGFEFDSEEEFTRIKSDQECIGLEYFLNRAVLM